MRENRFKIHSKKHKKEIQRKNNKKHVFRIHSVSLKRRGTRSDPRAPRQRVANSHTTTRQIQAAGGG